MNLGSKEDIISLINNSGATLCDIAASNNTTPDEVAKYLYELGIPLPSMAKDGSFDFIKMLKRGIKTECPATAILEDPLGGMQHMPKNAEGVYTPNIVTIYKTMHGNKITDAYTGEELTSHHIVYVDGDPNNYLVTNIEALGERSFKERFNHPVGIVEEVFHFSTRYFDFDIEIARKYDQLVGGTYNPDYVHNLFCTWVGYPLNLYFKQNIEDEAVFKHKTPMFVAWWSWAQLSNYALLKGIKSIKVTSNIVFSMEQVSTATKPLGSTTRSLAPNSMIHSALLRSTDVFESIHKNVLLTQATSFWNKHGNIKAP